MSTIKKIFLHLFAFVLIYYINLFPGWNPYVFPIICFVGLLFFDMVRTKKLRNVGRFKYRVSKRFIVGIILSAIYCALVYLIHNIDISLYDTRIVQNMIFLVYYGIVFIFIKYLDMVYDSPDEQMSFIFRVACVQGFICLIMLVFPQLKAIANDIFVKSSSFTEGSYILSSRIYGISNSYTYGLPILHGLLSGICFYYGVVVNKRFFIYFPLVLLVTLLNGRTGIIIALASIVIASLYLLFNSKRRMKIIVAIIGSVVAAFIALLILKIAVPTVYSFIVSAYNEIIRFIFSGELSGTSQYLLQDRLFFPEGFDLIFGVGKRVYGLHEYGLVSSDIGFVNDLFLGGMIYASILYYSYLTLINTSLETKRLKVVRLLIIVALLIANWKGEIFRNATFMVGLYFVILINAPRKKEFVV